MAIEFLQRRLCAKSPRFSIGALFVFVLLLSVTVQWHLLTSSEGILPDAHAPDKQRTSSGGIDKSFFLSESEQSKRRFPTKQVDDREDEKKNSNEQFRETSEPADLKQADASRHQQEGKKRPQRSNPSSSANTNSSYYTEDSLCGGCRSLKMEHLERGVHKERCGILIYKFAQEEGFTIKQAARHVVWKLKHSDCLPCLKCDPEERRYWRYDRAAPTLSNAKTHYLQSLPEDVHRIPQSVLNDPQANLEDYFSKLNQQGGDPKPYLFEYNPSIVPLPEYAKADLQGLKDSDQAVYLASFRVATTQACFGTETTLQLIGGEWESEKRPQKKDYLGLALLTEDLSTIVAEAIVDLPRPFRKREDFRLFVLHGQLYVATYCKITPMWLLHRSQTKKFEGRLQFNQSAVVHTWEAIQSFDSPLRVKIGSGITQCAKEENDNKHSKNLNYFVDAQNPQHTMMEMFPLAPHTIRHLPHIQDDQAETPTRADDITTEYMPPRPSFYTIEEPILADEMSFFEPPFTQDRGGACCIEIEHPDNPQEKLWLGIAHAKTPHARRKLKDRLASNQYLSRWYAFEQSHPYKIVAVSGFFCLPQPQQSDSTNPLATHSARVLRRWTMGAIAFDCPVIHFVTGMTVKVGDPETWILAYGVSDCTSWFAEVKKADVVEMLFHGPERLQH